MERITKTVYVANDGTTFDSESLCREYEQSGFEDQPGNSPMSDIDLSKIINKNGKYIITVSWVVISSVTVEADNLEETLNICKKTT